MEDRQIIELFFARSEQAIAELSEKYGALCQKLAENIVGDRLDAEECVNDAYLAMWNTIPPNQPDPLVSYLCRIVRNLALNRYHANTALKRGSRYDIALDDLADCLPSSSLVEEEMEVQELAACLDAFLETLSSKDRVLFVRRYWQADDIGDLAELFHTGKHYISVRLSRIRKALKKYLSQKGVSL